MKKRENRRRSDIRRYPPRSSARRQDLEIGVPIIATLYTVRSKLQTATFAGRARAKCITVGRRGDKSSTRVGSAALLRDREKDNYFRNDSMKYCRHEEKKEKETEMEGGVAQLYRLPNWPVHHSKF